MLKSLLAARIFLIAQIGTATMVSLAPRALAADQAEAPTGLFAAPARVPQSHSATDVNTSSPEPVIHPSPTLSRFDHALPEIARQAHLALVCEGQPFHLELTEVQTKELSDQFGTSGLPLEKAIGAIASAYDYDAVRTGPHVYLLNKRYSEPDDLPDIPYEESATSLRNILKATQDYIPPFASESRLRYLYNASDEERAQLAKGIPVASLPADQRHMLRQVICGLTFPYLHDIKWVSRRLDACQSPDAAFVPAETISYMVDSHFNCPVFVGPFGVVDKKPREFFLSGLVYTESGGASSFDKAFSFASGKPVLTDLNAVDITTPRHTIPVIPASTLRLSLQQAAAHLNQRYSSSRPDRPAITVEAALASKSVCIAGEEYAPPNDLLQAVADVYGLSIRSLDGVDTLIQPLPRNVKDPSEVPAEIRRLLPLPFLEKVDTRTDAPAYINVPAPNGRTMLAPNPNRDKTLSHSLALYNFAIRRAREVVEPEMQKRQDHRLPAREADEEARRMIALASLASLAKGFKIYANRIPPTLSDLDSGTVQIVPSGRGDSCHFYFYDPLNPAGEARERHGHGGGFNVPTADPNIKGAVTSMVLVIGPTLPPLPE